MRTILCATAALAALLATTTAADAETATGCLKNGRLVHVAIGDEPSRACAGDAKEVVLSVHEPGRAMRFHEVLGFGEEIYLMLGSS